MSVILVCACAEKKTRIWIDPPIGYSGANPQGKNLYYKIEDAAGGKKESLSIPLNQLPQNLVVESPTKREGDGGNVSATKADELFFQGKLPDNSGKRAAPTVSYLRGIQEVEKLYQRAAYNEALIRLTPLLEQYPDQSRLYLMQGTLYRRIGEKKMALLSFQRAHELDKNNVTIEEALTRTQDEAGGTP